MDQRPTSSRFKSRAVFGLLCLLCLAALVTQNSIAGSGRVVMDTDYPQLHWLSKRHRSCNSTSDDIFWVGKGRTVAVDYAATVSADSGRKAEIEIKPWESYRHLAEVQIRADGAGRLTAPITEDGFYQVKITAYRDHHSWPENGFAGRIEARWSIQ